MRVRDYLGPRPFIDSDEMIEVEHYMSSNVDIDDSKIIISRRPQNDRDNQEPSALYNRQSLKKS